MALRTILILLGVALAAATAAAATHDYTVEIDNEMQRMSVEARFAHPVDSVRARSRDAGRFIEDPRHCRDGASLRRQGRRLYSRTGQLDCIRYEVDLVGAAAAERRNSVLADSNIIVSPTEWLWRPRINERDELRVRFVLDDPHAVSVPWAVVPGEPDTFVVRESPESSEALAAFGELEFAERRIPGATLRITVLQPERGIRSEQYVDWVTSAARNIVLAYGRFPNPSPQVMVLPVGESRWNPDSAVPYGRVVRDGGETIELFVNQWRPIDDFYDDWTATHEFSHLMLPYITRDYRWISEGFASYYQNVPLSRAGHYSEQHAWQKLWEGFERGRKSRPELSPNQAARAGVRRATMKIYWSGAAIALLADVELRRRSDGRDSLDTVLDNLARCCLPSDRIWGGREFFEQLDSLLDEPVFIPLYRQFANTTGFPDLRPTLRMLGVDVTRGRVRLRDGAELAELRRAMIGSWEQAASR